MSVATAILRKWLGPLTATLTFGTIVECACADGRPSNITNVPGPAGELTLGCLPKADAVTVYLRNKSKPPAPEHRSVLEGFPNGFEKQTLQVGRDLHRDDTLIVEELLQVHGRQLLRGFIIDDRGWTANGTYYVYPQDWGCSLHVNPSN